MKVGLWRSVPKGLALLATLGIVFAAPASAEPAQNSIQGSITEVSRSAEVVLVEEEPSEESGSDKGEFAVTGETEILEGRGEDLAPVSFEALRVGQVVEATYDGPVAESYPTQGVAGRIVILDKGDTPTVLPDTGGALVLALGAFAIGGGLLLSRVACYSFLYGLPIAAGATARPAKATRATMVRM